MEHLNSARADMSLYHPAIFPIDSQSGANNGLVVSLKNWAGVEIVVFKAVGTAGDDPNVTVTQAQAIAGTGEKALPIPAGRIHYKLHATTVPGLYTAVSDAEADGVYVDATSAEKKGIITIDIKADDLDVDNGFDCVRVAIPDTGLAGAQLLCAFYRFYGPRYGGAGMVSPIAD